MGKLKSYDVSGLDSGNGVPFPADTRLRLDDGTAERMGLKKPSKTADPDAKPAPADGDKKRPAPAKRAPAKRASKAAGARKRSAPAKD